jgi:hypothetical protein
MGRVINTTAMTVDGVIDWFVAEGEHDAASLSLFGDARRCCSGARPTRA